MEFLQTKKTRARNRLDREREEFQRCFDTEAGKFVLMWMYEHWYGKQSTWPSSGDATELARNEGTRLAWLQVLERLREEDLAIRRMFEEYVTEKRMEQMNE